ncbi:chemotaxis protein CheX [Nautilia sp.]
MGVVKSFLGPKAYYRPQGFLDANNVRMIITPADLKAFEQKNIKYVSIDFSKIVSANINAVRFLNDVFENLYKKDVECSFFNLNKNVYNLVLKIKNRFFNIYESEEVEKVFTTDEIINKDIYICGIKNEENRNLIIYHLVKKGYFPLTVAGEEEIKNRKNAVIIKDSIVSKFSNRVSAVVRENIVYFYFEGFLDTEITRKFDMDYFRRSLSIGFRVFVFNMGNVKGLNIHAVNFLSKLGVESAEYGALMIIVGLNSKNTQKKLINDLEVVGFVFFADENEMLASEIVKSARKNMSIVYKKQKKITKDLVNLLPYFVNSTINTIELMTGIKAEKEKPELTSMNIDTTLNHIASSLGFYGDIDGMVVLIFSEKLTKKISYILLGEESSSPEELYDIVSEFANIIVGNTKTEFAKHNVHINMILPKVFNSLENLKILVSEKKAIEVKFYFDEEEFYFYLTR